MILAFKAIHFKQIYNRRIRSSLVKMKFLSKILTLLLSIKVIFCLDISYHNGSSIEIPENDDSYDVSYFPIYNHNKDEVSSSKSILSQTAPISILSNFSGQTENLGSQMEQRNSAIFASKRSEIKLNKGEVNLLIENSIIKLGTKLYDIINRGGVYGNIIFSPFSVEIVLTILYAGSGGKTKQNMKNALGLSKKFESQITPYYKELLKPLQNSSFLQIATGFFLMKGYEIKTPFQIEATNDFYSEVKLIDFRDNYRAAKTINNWVAAKTRNKITDLISPAMLDESTRLILVNAVYFKGSWRNKFVKRLTADAKFFINENQTKTVKMMHQTAKFRYGKIDALKSTVLEMPYADTDISMVLILPDHVNGIGYLMEAFGDIDFTLLERYLDFETVLVSLPKFSTEFTINLNSPLKKLGLSDIFTPSANFNKILESSNGIPEPLFVSDILQKGFIEVNEVGATAAAATRVTIVKRYLRPIRPPMRMIFNANHPFLYFIKTPSEILFIGKYFE